jgi:hypothetical protein
VPQLQCEHGVVEFFRVHREQPWAFFGVNEPDHAPFVAALEFRSTASRLSNFVKGSAKVMSGGTLGAVHRRRGDRVHRQGARKVPVLRTEKRRNPKTGQSYPRIVKSTAIVNQFYIYAVDRDFVPFFLKFCSYFPYNGKLCINGHEYAKRQPAQNGIRSRPWTTVFLAAPTSSGDRRSAMDFRRRESMRYYEMVRCYLAALTGRSENQITQAAISYQLRAFASTA